MDKEQNLQLLQELISCGSNIYTWCYDVSGLLLSSNCPDEAIFDAAFELFGSKDKALKLGEQDSPPVILGTSFGLIWGVDFEKHDGRPYRFHVIGPAFFLDVAAKDIDQSLRSYAYKDVSLEWKYQFLKATKNLPVAQNIVFLRYLLMLHYCLTGEKLDASTVNFQNFQTSPAVAGGQRDRNKVYFAERAMLRMVVNGDLNYKSALSASFLISTGVPVQGGDPLRRAKTSVIVFTTIVSRAAIEGGLSPEEAYSLGDSYIQTAESADTYDEIVAIPLLMYDDFVRRVNKHRVNPKLSGAVRHCCDYIEMHLDRKILARDLAALVGYSEYYLTAKFKEETGFSIANYTKMAKIERAKMMLETSDLSIQEIADALGFGNRSYFSRVFTDIVGKAPAEFKASL